MEDLDDSGLLPLAVERGWITKDQATSGRLLRELISAQQLAELRQERQLANRILQDGFLAPRPSPWRKVAVSAAFGAVLLVGGILLLPRPNPPIPPPPDPRYLENCERAEKTLKEDRSRERILEALHCALLALEIRACPEAYELLTRVLLHSMQGGPKRFQPIDGDLWAFVTDTRSRLAHHRHDPAPLTTRGMLDVVRSFLICDKIEDPSSERKDRLRQDLRDSAREAVGLLERACGGSWEAPLGLAIVHTLLGVYGDDGEGLKRGGEWLAKADRMSPENPEVARWTGYYHFVKDEFPQAVAAWKRALKLGPEYEDELNSLIRKAEK